MMTSVAIEKLVAKLEAIGEDAPMRKRDIGPTKKDVVFALGPRIKTMLRGTAKTRWSHADVVDWLSQQGVVISLHTFGQYIRAYERTLKLKASLNAVATKSAPVTEVNTPSMPATAPSPAPRVKPESLNNDAAASKVAAAMQRAATDPRSL